MSVSTEFAESNRTQTERLRQLVQRLTPEMLAVRLPRGWTVSVALAHVAFWDRQRLCLMRRWADGVECHNRYDGELFNEALLPLLQAIPPVKAAALALSTAEEVDAFFCSPCLTTSSRWRWNDQTSRISIVARIASIISTASIRR